MPTLTFEQLARMVGGSVIQHGEVETCSVVIDSREVKEDSVFVAIRGDRLDGHQFLLQALQSARGAVVQEVPHPLPAGKGIVQVDDTTVALQRLARAIRENYPFLLIGVTGSAGKTTTKEMISTLAATERATWKSWGNFNNQIGFPLCMANTPDGTAVVVSEMGMSSKGEIEQLARLSYPNVGVYTNIKPVHLEFFKSIDGIAAAKRELLENLAPRGVIVINADDPKVMQISHGFKGTKVRYGLGESAEVRATEVADRGLLGTSFTLLAENEKRRIELPLPGRHNLENLLAAIATARVIGISWDGIMRGIAALKPAYHRGVVLQLRGATIYDDTYNSNPYALGRTLELLGKADAPGRKIAIIGDMLELGPDELKFHHDAGKAIPRGIAIVIGVGKRSVSVLEGAREAGFADEALHHFLDAEAVIPFVRELLEPGDLVLLKASRGIGLDRVVTALESEG